MKKNRFILLPLVLLTQILFISDGVWGQDDKKDRKVRLINIQGSTGKVVENRIFSGNQRNSNNPTTTTTNSNNTNNTNTKVNGSTLSAPSAPTPITTISPQSIEFVPNGLIRRQNLNQPIEIGGGINMYVPSGAGGGGSAGQNLRVDYGVLQVLEPDYKAAFERLQVYNNLVATKDATANGLNLIEERLKARQTELNAQLSNTRGITILGGKDNNRTETRRQAKDQLEIISKQLLAIEAVRPAVDQIVQVTVDENQLARDQQIVKNYEDRAQNLQTNYLNALRLGGANALDVGGGVGGRVYTYTGQRADCNDPQFIDGFSPIKAGINLNSETISNFSVGERSCSESTCFKKLARLMDGLCSGMVSCLDRQTNRRYLKPVYCKRSQCGDPARCALDEDFNINSQLSQVPLNISIGPSSGGEPSEVTTD